MKRQLLSTESLNKLREWDKNYRRNWRKNNKEKKLKEISDWRLKNPEKKHAHDKVYEALKSGLINKENCRDCGSKNTQAHHYDYSKPLDVIWLCPSHHKLEDLKMVDKSNL